jgi:transcription antitermination factor NusG
MYVSYSRELKVKEVLEDLSIDCYVPMRYELVEHEGVRHRELIPAIHNLIFVRSSQERLTELKMTNKTCTLMQYMIAKPRISQEQADIITVPDAQMKNFMRVADSHDEKVMFLEYTDFLDKEGKKVRIVDGNFMGVEGVIKRIKKNKIVVVLLKGIAAVAVTHIHPHQLELIEE